MQIFQMLIRSIIKYKNFTCVNTTQYSHQKF